MLVILFVRRCLKDHIFQTLEYYLLKTKFKINNLLTKSSKIDFTSHKNEASYNCCASYEPNDPFFQFSLFCKNVLLFGDILSATQ